MFGWTFMYWDFLFLIKEGKQAQMCMFMNNSMFPHTPLRMQECTSTCQSVLFTRVHMYMHLCMHMHLTISSCLNPGKRKTGQKSIDPRGSDIGFFILKVEIQNKFNQEFDITGLAIYYEYMESNSFPNIPARSSKSLRIQALAHACQEFDLFWLLLPCLILEHINIACLLL